jgi:hypothetical protein
VLGRAETAQRRVAHNLALSAAWHGEMLARQKRLPALKSLLAQPAAKKTARPTGEAAWAGMRIQLERIAIEQQKRKGQADQGGSTR